jgi:hypothetical protein
MENSIRKDNYEKQLKTYIPTKYVYIVYNKGFKNCTKKLYKQQTNYDIIDVNLNIMKHSFYNNYNTILILEDDFIFNPEIIKPNTINNIEQFFNNNQHIDFYFNLGPVPILFNIKPTNNIYKGIFTLCNQGIIYKKNIIKQIINDPFIYKYMHIDNYITNKYIHYFYKIPLIIQTFPITENQKNWCIFENNLCISIILNFIFKILNINNYPIIGWYKMYTILFFFNYLLFIFIIIFIYYIIYRIYKLL